MIVLEWRFLTIAPCDAAEPWQLGSQDAATPMMQGIIDLHHDIFFFLILILVFVSRILVRALWHLCYHIRPLYMDPPAAGAAGPLPAPAGGNGAADPDEDKRKRIRRAFARHIKTVCARYCANMGFCGRFCSRGRPGFDYYSVADQLLREEFDYHRASGEPLHNLYKLVLNANRKPEDWHKLIDSHWVYDLMRYVPKK